MYKCSASSNICVYAQSLYVFLWKIVAPCSPDQNRFGQDVVAAQSYDSIFSVLEHVATGSEPGFHAKNLANTLEHRFFDYSWKQSPESDS